MKTGFQKHSEFNRLCVNAEPSTQRLPASQRVTKLRPADILITTQPDAQTIGERDDDTKI